MEKKINIQIRMKTPEFINIFYDILPVFQEALHLQKKMQLSQEH